MHYSAWRHLFLYDRETLKVTLQNAGLRHVAFISLEVSEAENPGGSGIAGSDDTVGENNQFETFVAEAQK
jgi:hypothetical protein